MKRLPVLLAAGLASCASPQAVSVPPPEGAIIEVRELLTCTAPASRTLVTVARDGKAERVIFDGLEFDIDKTKSSRERLTLSPSDADELFRLVADSGWEKMPEGPDKPACADCCSVAVLIKTTDGAKSLRSSAEGKPPRLYSLIKGMDAILARGTWKRIVYEWEKQR